MRKRTLSYRLFATLISAFVVAGSACSSPPTSPTPDVPTVVKVPVASRGAFDTTTYYPGCEVGPGSPVEPSTTCPVVRWDGYDYWAMAYHDNRSSMAIHVFDATGRLLNVVERPGARYLYAIDVDQAAKTVTFHGQTDRTIVMTWDALRALR